MHLFILLGVFLVGNETKEQLVDIILFMIMYSTDVESRRVVNVYQM